jgi:UDP-glucose 4-epimerase
VLEAIKSFEKVSGVKLNYEIGPRRPGDIIAIYANNDKAKKLLGWDPKYLPGRNAGYRLEMGTEAER